jgi:hypothetical protein
VLANARRELIGLRTSSRTWVDGFREASELVCPQHPHQLASWVLLHKKQPIDAAAMPTPDSVPVARAWLHLATPAFENILTRCSERTAATVLTQALWLQQEPDHRTLKALLTSDCPPAQRAVLALGKPEPPPSGCCAIRGS